MTETCEHGSYPGVCFHCGERMKHELRLLAATGKAGVVRPVTHSLFAAAGIPGVAAIEWIDPPGGRCHPVCRTVCEECKVLGPNDYFEVASNNSPDPVDDDDEVIEPQDYAGDYPLEGDGGDEVDEDG